MRLDPIKIPVFNGDPANWLPFKDLFEALVHNRTDLDSSYKLIQVDDCEKIFNDTVTRTSDGRYQVQILFRPDAPALGESHQSAVRQFLQLERRLMNDPCLREQYITFMREYIALDHMEVSRETFIGKETGYFIPHHAVTTKFRVVFNASAKTSNGTSLNDTQFSGPQLHANIVDILNRFRKFNVAITADVKKMFRQILIDTRHRKWQRILWRESPDEPLQVYELKTVTYGMACSPFNAIRALRQCANDNYKVIYDPSRAAAARHSILYNFYVDDYLDSVDSDELAVTRAQDVATVFETRTINIGKVEFQLYTCIIYNNRTTASASELELDNSTTKIVGRSQIIALKPFLDTDGILRRGDIVLIRGENLPPSVWRMGRVIDVHPGSDGLVRTVTIEYNANQRSSDGIPIKQRCQRPVQKLCRNGPAEELLNREGSAGQDVQDLSTLECSPVHN
nr:uncharacterized protein LOC118680467 [Bactrocera oleae]